jgi:putative ABC transport system permease protein
MQSLLQDLRYGFRTLARAPGFTAVAVLTLALGIGANTAMFSVVDAVLLHPLPFRDSSRLVQTDASPRQMTTYPQGHWEWANWAGGTKTLSDISVYEAGELNLAGEGEPDRVPAAEVSVHFFSALGVNPIQGRTFLPAEEALDHPSVAIVSYELWRSHFGLDPNLLGGSIRLNGKPFTVVGIMPKGCQFPGEARIWVPLPSSFDGEMFGGNVIWWQQLARLRPGATLDQARAELRTITPRPPGAPPVQVTPLEETIVGSLRPAMLLLFGSVGFVLLIACANAANLSLARSATRLREAAVRAALGASRARLVRQLLTETVLLSLLGGLLGLLVATGSLALVKTRIPVFAFFVNRVGIEGRINVWVPAFTFAVAVLTGIIAGLAPALQSSKRELTEALKESGASARTGFSLRSRYRLRGFLGVFETATALVLLIGAGLLIRSFGKLLDVNPGFRTQDLLAARVTLLEPTYSAPERLTAFFQEVLARVKALPGVRDAAFINAPPLTPTLRAVIPLEVEGGSEPQTEAGLGAVYVVVSPGYFKTVGIPLPLGQDFTERDTKSSTSVAIISESLARRAWPNQNPLGKHFRLRFPSGQHWVQVVGVAGDVRRMLTEQPESLMYFPIAQRPPDAAYLVAHSTQNPTVMGPALRGVVRAVDKNEPISSISTMEQFISQSVAQPRFRTLLLGIFAGLAFLLAVVGIYGIVSYSVSQRTHEIGIRMALGAERRNVLGLVVGQGMAVALMGIGVGLAAAFGLTRLLASFLYGVRPTDPITFVVVSAVFVAVALLASYVPARRATKVDPIVALRYE